MIWGRFAAWLFLALGLQGSLELASALVLALVLVLAWVLAGLGQVACCNH